MTAIVGFLTTSAVGGNGPSTASVTHMMAIAHTGEAVSAFSSSNGNDPIYETPIGVAGTLQQYQMYLIANARTSTTSFGLAKGGTAKNSTVSFGSGATGAQIDSTHTDVVAAADNWSQYYTTGTGSGAMNGGMSCQFYPSSGTSYMIGAVGTGTAHTGTSVNHYEGVGGANTGVQATESNAQSLVTVPGTYSYFHSGISSNARTLSHSHNLRNNTANAGPTVSFASAATGLQIDSTHTGTFALNDLPAVQLALGTDSGAVTWNLNGLTYVSTTDGQVWSPSVKPGGVTGSAAGYTPPLGNFAVNATRLNSVIETNLPSSVWKNMAIRLSANASGTTTTETFNIGNTDKTLTVSFAAAATGRQQDSTHSDTPVGTDTVSVHQTGLNASITINEINFEYVVPYALVTDVLFGAEHLAGEQSSPVAPAFTAANENSTPVLQAEHLAGEKCDATVQAEHLAGERSDSQAQTTHTGNLASDRTIQAEHLASEVIGLAIYAEHLSAEVSSPIVQAEHLAGEQSDESIREVHSGNLSSAETVSAEHLAGEQSGGTMTAEHLAGEKSDTGINEASAGSLVSTAAVQAEYLAGERSDATIYEEHLAAEVSGHSVSAEHLAGEQSSGTIFGDRRAAEQTSGTVAAEHLAGETSSQVDPVAHGASSAGEISDQVMQVAHGAAVRSDGGAQAEHLASLASDSRSSVTYLARVQSDGTVVLSRRGVVGSSAMLSAATTANIRSALTAVLARLGRVSAGEQFDVSIFVSLESDTLVNVSYEGVHIQISTDWELRAPFRNWALVAPNYDWTIKAPFRNWSLAA